eukprot:3230606-Alexandrium_andersonii.AAC.1
MTARVAVPPLTSARTGRGARRASHAPRHLTGRRARRISPWTRAPPMAARRTMATVSLSPTSRIVFGGPWSMIPID